MTSLRVVAAGAGAQIFNAHRRGLEAIGATVVGGQDIDPDRLDRVAAELRCPAYLDPADLLRQPADLAVITASHPAHAGLALAGLRAGLHVLVEKPIAVQVAEADAMVTEAERRGRVLAVAFQQRTRPEVREARRLVREGVLGDLQHATLLATWPRRHSYFGLGPWRGTWRGEGGGVLLNQGEHDLDLLLHLAGPPSTVFGWTRTRLHPIEVEDTVEAILEWPSGMVGSVHISTAEVDEAQRIELTGSRGRLRLVHGRLDVERNRQDFREYAASAGDPFQGPEAGEVSTYVGEGGGHEDLYRDLAGALATGGAPIAPGLDAARALEVATAIIFSSKTGEVVRLPLDRGRYGDLLRDLRERSGKHELAGSS